VLLNLVGAIYDWPHLKFAKKVLPLKRPGLYPNQEQKTKRKNIQKSLSYHRTTLAAILDFQRHFIFKGI
jgi:hypothetical protein